MLSIIVCSRNSKLNKNFSDNIDNTIGVEHELICIDNSQNSFTISKAYNEGVLRSKYNYLCFVHEDVVMHTQNWGQKVIAHLDVPNTGLVGLAGGDAAFRILHDYGSLNRCTNIIHEDKEGILTAEHVLYPPDYTKSTRSVVLLDGVLLCAQRSVFEKISFDDSVGRFHGYDYDISIQSIIAGFQNYVMYDVLLTHYSKGNFDTTYYRSMIKVIQKWESKLPIYERSITNFNTSTLKKIKEKYLAKKLLKRLVRSQIKTADIIDIYSFYSKLTGSRAEWFFLKFIRIRISVIRTISVIRKRK